MRVMNLPKLPDRFDEIAESYAVKLPDEFSDLSPRRRNAILKLVYQERKKSMALGMKICVICLNQYFGWGIQRIVRFALKWRHMGAALNDDWDYRLKQVDEYIEEIGFKVSPTGIYGYQDETGKVIRRQTKEKWEQKFYSQSK